MSQYIKQATCFYLSVVVTNVMSPVVKGLVQFGDVIKRQLCMPVTDPCSDRALAEMRLTASKNHLLDEISKVADTVDSPFPFFRELVFVKDLLFSRPKSYSKVHPYYECIIVNPSTIGLINAMSSRGVDFNENLIAFVSFRLDPAFKKYIEAKNNLKMI